MLNPSRWSSNDPQRRFERTTELAPGDIVIIKRKPWRLREITPRPHINWPPEYLEAWEKDRSPDPATWWHRPFALVVDEEGKPATKHGWHCEAAGSRLWTVLPEHYAICRLCGDLPPCMHAHTEAIVEYATAQMDEAMKILPGHCHACYEYVRPRQGSIRFEGPNLIRPDLGEGSAVFHTNSDRKCWPAAYDYDKKWAAAVPGRRRKLSCDGMAIHHLDGTFECTSGPGCAFEHLGHQGGSVHHWAGQQGDCWCLTGEPRPSSTAQDADTNKLF